MFKVSLKSHFYGFSLQAAATGRRTHPFIKHNMADQRHNQLQVDLLIAVQHLHCLDGVVRVSARHSRVNACIFFAAYLNLSHVTV